MAFRDNGELVIRYGMKRKANHSLAGPKICDRWSLFFESIVNIRLPDVD